MRKRLRPKAGRRKTNEKNNCKTGNPWPKLPNNNNGQTNNKCKTEHNTLCDYYWINIYKDSDSVQMKQLWKDLAYLHIDLSLKNATYKYDNNETIALVNKLLSESYEVLERNCNSKHISGDDEDLMNNLIDLLYKYTNGKLIPICDRQDWMMENNSDKKVLEYTIGIVIASLAVLIIATVVITLAIKKYQSRNKNSDIEYMPIFPSEDDEYIHPKED